jgi:(2R)-ethylmalonyl-CoA mutase
VTRLEHPDAPWVMRTYAGHSSARATNALMRRNLARGQTGLSIAFDLPTQLGYDPDDEMSVGEVGRVGVPIAHRGDVDELFAELDLAQMNTSMTINATAPWLLALYLERAERTGAPWSRLAGTTQNDLVKEFLSRGTYIFDPESSRRVSVDLITFAVEHVPRWNPINVCSYHLQEAGATPVQEVAFALATAVDVLDAVRERGVGDDSFARAVGRISFFLNSGIRFVEEVAKVRAFAGLWREVVEERYGITDPRLSRFRYGVQVNSLGLTELQPENNVYRIILEALGVTLSRDARARALQLPAWNEAIGLPRAVDQQWSLRAQQILAYETDLLEYPDIFEGSRVVEALTAELAEAARERYQRIVDGGGAFARIDELKAELVRSQAERLRAIESGERVIVGVNRFQESEPSPLRREQEVVHQEVDEAEVAALLERLHEHRTRREGTRVAAARAALERAARGGGNLMEPTLELARAGGTTGEWAATLREVFGDYRAPTGVQAARGIWAGGLARTASPSRTPPRLLVAKPGLDGHSNGAEQIAVAARDAGFEVVYQGIRQRPEDIAAVARDEDVDLVGLSILSGSHRELVPRVLGELRRLGVDAPVVVGGIIPPEDAAWLLEHGVARVFTPRDWRLADVVRELGLLVADRPG